MTPTATHCPYCALQCGMNLVPGDGVPTVQAQKGGLCAKGWSAAELLGHPERLTTPLLRRTKSESLEPASWEEALGFVVDKIRRVQALHGRDAVGVFGGGGLTNEKAYLLGKFARVALRTANIDYNGRFCMSSAATAGIKAFGVDRGLPFPLEDIPGAETIMLIGSNLAETMPPAMRYMEVQREQGGRLIVVDPRRTPTAAAANLHLQLTPGSDSALANGMLHLAIAERLVDCRFIDERTNGYDAVHRAVASYWSDRVERITGVPVSQMRRAVQWLAESATAMLLTARGAEQQSKGVENVLSFINLMLALGKAGKPHCGYGCITGQGNGQGGREHGQKADQLPGYRSIENPDHRAYIASVWGIDEADLPGKGRSAYELLSTLGEEGSPRALLVMGSNPAVSAPRAGHVQERLRALDLLVVADIFRSETAELADVVLPTTQWAEESGTMTNLEGRVILRRKAIDPPEGVRSDLQILSQLAAGLGFESGFPSEPEPVFTELRQASAGGIADYSGITYERIAEEGGVFWPCPSPEHPGSPRLFLDRFATGDGRARFHPVMHKPPAEEPSEKYPLYLTTGRVMSQYQSGTQTRRVESLKKTNPEPFVEVHPTTAQLNDLEDGGNAVVKTKRGEAVFKVRIAPSIRQDTLFVPFHWGGNGCANLLTNPALDPASRMPEFKICACSIAPQGASD